MRTWGFADCGYTYNNTGSCYQTFTKGAAAPVYSDAAMKNLDYAIYRARQAGTHVVIPLTNNWQDLGGM
ncbi:MAG: hypothetical protein JWN96_1456, partial [Mycobacterium sp.]|nr:hypothetical protein [Mycobacterium sp.]